MSELEVLLKNWSFPARSPERAQLTLRIPLYDHQRLMALKAVYPNRSINDMVVDILEAALNDIVSKLPVSYYSKEDIANSDGMLDHDDLGQPWGLKVKFQRSLESIQESAKAGKVSPEEETA